MISPTDVQFWLFCVYCIFAVFIFLIISFYANRLLGWALSWLLRAVLERPPYRVHIDVGRRRFHAEIIAIVNRVSE